jgi:hypothetical protein
MDNHCANPLQAPYQHRNECAENFQEWSKRYRESLMYSFPSIVREQTVSGLTFLIKCESLTEDESFILMQASRIITSKGLPK